MNVANVQTGRWMPAGACDKISSAMFSYKKSHCSLELSWLTKDTRAGRSVIVKVSSAGSGLLLQVPRAVFLWGGCTGKKTSDTWNRSKTFIFNMTVVIYTVRSWNESTLQTKGCQKWSQKQCCRWLGLCSLKPTFLISAHNLTTITIYPW